MGTYSGHEMVQNKDESNWGWEDNEEHEGWEEEWKEE